METAVAENYDTNPAFAQGGNLDIPAFGGPMGIRWDEGACPHAPRRLRTAALPKKICFLMNLCVSATLR